MDLQFGVPS